MFLANLLTKNYAGLTFSAVVYCCFVIFAFQYRLPARQNERYQLGFISSVVFSQDDNDSNSQKNTTDIAMDRRIINSSLPSIYNDIFPNASLVPANSSHIPDLPSYADPIYYQASESIPQPPGPRSSVSQPSNVTKVVLLSYQRCGSTFVSQLFNSNPKAFYQFEPLDALYSATYGTEYGWNVPSDIRAFGNGSQRVIPSSDVRNVAEFLQNMLSCRVDSLPTDSLVHSFLFGIRDQYRNLEQFIACADRHKEAMECQSGTLHRFCGQKYGQADEVRRETCKRLVQDFTLTDTLKSIPQRMKLNISLYGRCMKDLRTTLNADCTEHLQDACEGSDLRAVKVVRATMRSMKPILASDPNARVIHLMRDPRGVALSRINLHESVRGQFANSAKRNRNEMIVREAAMYCQAVVDDVIVRQELEREFPGRILTVIYDEFVKDVKLSIRNVYNFLNYSLDASSSGQLVKLMTARPRKFLGVGRKAGGMTIVFRGGRARVVRTPNAPQYEPLNNEEKSKTPGATDAPISVLIANNWKRRMPSYTDKKVVRACKEFFRLVPYDWKL